MKIFNMHLLFFIKKHKTNKQGYCPIYVRITISKERLQYSTGLKIKPAFWNVKKHRSINNILLNKQIESIQIEVLNIVSSLRINKTLTIGELKNQLSPKNNTNTTIEKILDNYRLKKIKDNSFHYSDRFYKNLLIYIDKMNIKYIEALDHNFLNNFIAWLKTDRGVTNGKYFAKHYSYLNQSLELAFNQSLIKYNPLKRIDKPKFPKQKKQTQLTKKEVQQIKKYIPNSERLQKIKDLFLFACYTGIGFIDVQHFCKTQIKKTNSIQLIVGTRAKTKTKYTTPLFSKAKKILKKYDYVLPKISNQKYNKYLKEIATDLNINKNLTTHVARRTFGQIMLNKGYSIESVSHILGHSDIQVTQRCYAYAGEKLVINEIVRNTKNN